MRGGLVGGLSVPSRPALQYTETDHNDAPASIGCGRPLPRRRRGGGAAAAVGACRGYSRWEYCPVMFVLCVCVGGVSVGGWIMSMYIYIYICMGALSCCGFVFGMGVG